MDGLDAAPADDVPAGREVRPGHPREHLSRLRVGRFLEMVRQPEDAVDHLAQEVGDEVTFDRVLFVDSDGNASAGTPFVPAATVTGVVDSQARGPKLRVFRKRRRKGWRRTLGHRAALTRVRITGITTG